MKNNGSNRKKVRNRKHGFTLIELLAVIIILGVLMIIAIPSVTEYIQSSRKNAYITTATQYISGARNKINSSEISMYDTEATYYLPASCISLEKGGNSPFGEWVDAYIVVTYDGFGYDYYWTSRDSSNMGILLTDEKLLDESRVQAGITSISTEVGIDDREKILIINNCDANDLTESEAETTIPIDGMLEENIIDDGSRKVYTILKEEAVLDSIASTYVTSSTGIDFNTPPSDTNGKGLYIRSGTENNKNPIYYYRGAVTNNNVIFADLCWKIVRTTETGGIKLVYNGQPTDGKCTALANAAQIGTSVFNTNTRDNAYVGYMYGTPNTSTYEETHANTNNSAVKIMIDEWYKTNIDDKGYTKKLEDTVWCNDRSITTYNGTTGTGTEKSLTYYSVYTRVGDGAGTNVQPSLECANVNDRFTVSKSNGNGALKYPVALLTADETTLAGHGWDGCSTSSYLYTQNYWWSLSPRRHDGVNALVFQVKEGLRSVSAGDPRGVRPSISLKPGTKFVEGGDGTKNNPYIVK